MKIFPSLTLPQLRLPRLTLKPLGGICPETLLTEFVSGGTALFWAVLLFLPVHLFQSNPAFRDLPRVGAEWKWGIVAVFTAALHLYGILRRTPLFRWLGLVFGFAFLIGLVSCFLQATKYYHGIPINTGVGAYSVMATADFLAAVWIGTYVQADLLAKIEQKQEWKKRRKLARGIL